MGLKTFGFGFGREDIWEPEEIFWGPEDTWLGDERYSGDRELSGPLGARADGPDLREPGGAQRQAGALACRPRHPRDVRPHGDERRGDGRADRRRPHGRQGPRRSRPPTTSARSPRARRWRTKAWAGRTSYGSGKGDDTITSGLEGAWTNDPTRWDNGYLENLYGYDWDLTKSPAGAWQWMPTNPEAQGTVPDAHDPSKRRTPMMLTTDLALKLDPIYGPITRHFLDHPEELADAFAKAWYKLLHRDMGPLSRYLGPWIARAAAVAGPGSGGRPRADRRRGHRHAQARLLDSGLIRRPAGLHRLGVGGELPRHRQARRGQRGADPAGAAEGLAGQRAGHAG